MPFAEPCLAIGYGADSIRAVLTWSDGRWQPLSFHDGDRVLSGAVHTAEMEGGRTAWQAAATTPAGFTPSSPLRTPTGENETPDQAGAMLRQVTEAAERVLGRPADDARIVVPAGWGPRRRMWLRQAAHQAGLGQPRLVEAPVAAADRLITTGVQVPVGAFLLICDLGAGGEATVLRRGPAGFEVLSTLADPQAGGAAMDQRLTAALLPDVPPDSPSWWLAQAGVRTAREQLSAQPVVTVPLPPPTPPMVLHGRVVEEVVASVLTRAGQLAARAVEAAELTVDQLAGVYLIGGAAVAPAAARVIGGVLGVDPVVMPDPSVAAVLGAAGAHTGTLASAAPAGESAAVPPLRRLWSILIPGFASLVLYSHMVFTASFHNGTRGSPRAFYYVLATWGELATAAVFALLATLAAAPLFGAALDQALHRDGATTHRGRTDPEGQIIGGLVLAITSGLAIAAIYGAAAAIYFGLPIGGPLRWALFPVLPTAALAAGLAGLAARRPVRPPHGWDALLAFPISSTVLTAVGMLLFAVWWQGPIPAVVAGFKDLIGHAGGVLVGAGIACALVRHPGLRAGLAVFLGLFGFLVVGAGGAAVLAVAYAVAVTVWWGYRLWLMLRLPADAARSFDPAVAVADHTIGARGDHAN